MDQPIVEIKCDEAHLGLNDSLNYTLHENFNPPSICPQPLGIAARLRIDEAQRLNPEGGG